MLASEYLAICGKLIPDNLKLVEVAVSYPDDDPEFGYQEGGQTVHKIGKAELMEVLRETAIEYSKREILDEEENIVDGTMESWYTSDRTPKILQDVLNAYEEAREHDCGRSTLMTVKEYKKRKEAKEREKYQSLASEIAQQYNVKVDTIEFVRAVKRHYARLCSSERDYRENPESRMERYACYDDKQNYYRDNDYSSGLEYGYQQDCRGLLRYLYRYCPLLMAQYKEAKLRRKK